MTHISDSGHCHGNGNGGYVGVAEAVRRDHLTGQKRIWPMELMHDDEHHEMTIGNPNKIPIRTQKMSPYSTVRYSTRSSG